MNHFATLIASPDVHRLAWTLLHFLWQGALAAALYLPVRFALLRTSTRVRYGVACGFLAAMVAAPVVTWLRLAPAAELPVAHSVAVLAHHYHRVDGFTAPAANVAAVPRLPLSLPDPLPAGLVTLWLLGVAVLALRGIGGWLCASRLPRRRSRSAPPLWQLRLDLLARRLGMSRPVRLLTSAAVPVPVVVGWLRPVILVPMGALAGLPREQLEAVLAHELAHVLRHDYLVNLLQGAAETLLFYHPAVWWISGQVRAERESCCDDRAVAVAGDALVYANALLALETRRQWSERPALAATGGSLSRRIARLIAAPRTAASSAPWCLALLLAAAAGASVGAARAARAQTAPVPRFEVASIKPSGPQVPGGWAGVQALPGGRFRSVDEPLRWLIEAAYGVQPYQIVGGENWINTQHYDVEAHGDSSANKAQVALMLRALLEDRFQFRYHLETRPMPVYVLSPGKNGPHLLTPASGVCRAYAPPGKTDLATCSNIHGSSRGVTITVGAVHMSDFVQILAKVVGRPVVDKTGATTPFDAEITFQNGVGAPDSAGGEPVPSLPAALEEKLGLRLESTKEPVQVMVIDHVARPTPN